MKRCKHDNLIITEYGSSHNTHQFEDGEYKFSNHGLGTLDGPVTYRCQDCGKVCTHGRLSLPKWLKLRIESAYKDYMPT